MNSVRVTHHFDTDAINGLISTPGNGVARDLLRRGIRVQTTARRRLSTDPKRIDTGRLRNSIGVRQQVRGVVVTTVGTNVKYAPYVLFGTTRMRANPFLFDALKAAKN